MKLNLYNLKLILALVLIISACRKTDEEEDSILTLDNTLSSTSTPAVLPTNAGMTNYESYFIPQADGKKHGYIISLPKDYNSSSSTVYPLLIFLHGGGQRPINAAVETAKLKTDGPHKEIYSNQKSYSGIIVSLQMYQWESEVNPKVVKELIDILTSVKAPSTVTGDKKGLTGYKIDLNRIHLTGISLGGQGVYKTAAAYPSSFASISIFGGFVISQTDMSKIKVATYIRHNLNDDMVSVSNAYNARDWINRANPVQAVNFQIFNANVHDCWAQEYVRTDNANIFQWHWNIVKNGTSNPAPIPEAEPQPPATVAINTTNPAKNSTLAANSSATLTAQFNVNIKKGAGNIEVKNLTDNTIHTVQVSSSDVTISGSTLTIKAINLTAGKQYAIRIAKGAVTDLSGNQFAGITNDTTWYFSISAASSGSAFDAVTFSPANASTISKPANGYLHVSLTFNRAVQKGTGMIKVKNITDNTEFTAYASWGMVTVNGSKATVYPVQVSSGKKYAVTIASNAFKDSAGKFYTGISSTSTWTFTVR